MITPISLSSESAVDADTISVRFFMNFLSVAISSLALIIVLPVCLTIDFSTASVAAPDLPFARAPSPRVDQLAGSDITSRTTSANQ